MTSQDEYVMYIFVNHDLEMTKGKIASQVGHAVNMVTEDIMEMKYESFQTPDQVRDYMVWKQNDAMIVLKATTEQLKELAKRTNARPVFDYGKTTQVKSGSLTAVGFFPSKKQPEFADYKLL